MPTTALKLPVDVGLADKNPLVRTALSEFFDRDERFNLVLTVSDAQTFLNALDRLTLDVMVAGWVLPPMGGVAFLDALRERTPMPRVVIYSGSSDPDLPRKVMARGGAGYCSKSEEPQHLLDTVLAVASGKMVFPFVDVRRLSDDPLQHLTPKERELLAALSTGRTNNQLAGDFGVSINTIKFHLRNLYEKMEIKNRTQAVAAYFSSIAG